MSFWEKLIFIIFICIFGFSFLRGCSEQSMTRSWGGEMEVSLEPNEKLLEVTWKEDSLWFLTRPMTDKDSEEIYKFYEKDTLGMLEGCVTIKENKLTETEIKEYEEQLKLSEDYFKQGNIIYDEETYEEKEVFIQYNVETNTYVLLKPYTYDEHGVLIEE